MNDKQYNELMTSLDRVESQLDSMLNSIKMLKEIKYEIIKKRHAHTKYVKFKKMNVSMKGEYKILLNELITNTLYVNLHLFENPIPSTYQQLTNNTQALFF